jgi:hypothetical protein
MPTDSWVKVVQRLSKIRLLCKGSSPCEQLVTGVKVRARTQEVHRLVHYHLPILPLWQITDRFAVRNTIQGVTPNPVTLYQDIQRWRLK